MIVAGRRASSLSRFMHSYAVHFGHGDVQKHRVDAPCVDERSASAPLLAEKRLE
jgi:hypothetical protein